VLNPELAAALGAERFQREIEIAAGLHQPHILPLHDSGEAGGFLYYVMPLSEGESLRDRLVREKQLPIEDALRIAREVADALSYAHSHDVIHRDIKPENILLESGHAVVADFGIARAITAAGGQTLTGTGMAIGTPAYMSPEQAAGEKNLDGRTDLYALGCVLYEMLAGQPPFTGPTTESVIRQHMAVEAPSIRGIRPAVPASVAAAIQRALAKTPADRFGTVALFAEALGSTDAQTQGRTDAQSRRAVLPAYRLAALLVVIALPWLAWRAFRSTEQAIAAGISRQVTRDPALEVQPAISPDGREVAYATGYPGRMHLEVRDVSGGRPLSLTGDWEAWQMRPRWTPDGRSIRFLNGSGSPTAEHGMGVWTIPRMGGPAVTAGPDGTTEVSRQRVLEQRADSLFARNTDGTETLLLTGGGHSATWSSDGSTLAFVRGNVGYTAWFSLGNIAPSSIWVVTVGRSPVRVTDDSKLNVSPAWLPDGRLLFVSNRDGPRDLYVARPGRAGQLLGTPVRLTTGLNAYSVSVSDDGATVAYDQFLSRRNIYTLSLPRGGSVSIREARPLTALNQTVGQTGISRDGRWLTFDSNLDGNQQIYVMAAAGGEPRRVTRHPGDDVAPDFSPDGREIVFHSTRNGPRDINLINADGTGEQRLTSGATDSYTPSFSPDGLRVAYVGLPGISVIRRDSIGGAWHAPELVVPGGLRPHWSPDGSRLLFTRAPGERGMIGIVTLGGAERRLVEGRPGGLQGLQALWWSADSSTVYFSATRSDGAGVFVIPAAGGRPRLVVRFDDPALRVFGTPLSVGNGLFYFVIGEMESDIYVMDLVYR
jgi:serine/threonine-protein kinase